MTTPNDKMRRVVQRTRGAGHGFITRLMSPSDLGQIVKPFVFLDIFGTDPTGIQAMKAGGGMPIHPHSGIATITIFTEGHMRYDDPDAGTGILAYGGVEWMRAGGGVWHGKEMSPGDVEHAFAWSALMTGVAFAVVGAMKSRFVDQSWWRSALETLLVGGLAAALAYAAGALLQTVA